MFLTAIESLFMIAGMGAAENILRNIGFTMVFSGVEKKDLLCAIEKRIEEFKRRFPNVLQGHFEEGISIPALLYCGITDALQQMLIIERESLDAIIVDFSLIRQSAVRNGKIEFKPNT
ncbi:MAG: hypothetical protein WCG83_01440 [Candidatus Peregrinibacteria bacterium]